jgi:hypothetical protein
LPSTRIPLYPKSGVGGVVVGIVLLGLVSILYHHAKTGVPPVPSTAEEISAVVELLREVNLPPGARIYELGCGWGSLALELARAFPDAAIVGFEVSWLPFIVARLRALRHPRVAILRRDFLDESLAHADAVTAYLMIEPMNRLAPHLDRNLREGTPVVALCFGFRDRTPVSARRLKKLGNEAMLYRWTTSVTS